MESLPAEGLGEQNEQAWDNWLVESDSDSSGESDWINVESDGSNNLEIGDNDSEMASGEPDSGKLDQHEQSSARISSLATTKVDVPRILYRTRPDVLLRYLRRQILG